MENIILVLLLLVVVEVYRAWRMEIELKKEKNRPLDLFVAKSLGDLAKKVEQLKTTIKNKECFDEDDRDKLYDVNKKMYSGFDTTVEHTSRAMLTAEAITQMITRLELKINQLARLVAAQPLKEDENGK